MAMPMAGSRCINGRRNTKVLKIQRGSCSPSQLLASHNFQAVAFAKCLNKNLTLFLKIQFYKRAGQPRFLTMRTAEKQHCMFITAMLKPTRAKVYKAQGYFLLEVVGRATVGGKMHAPSVSWEVSDGNT